MVFELQLHTHAYEPCKEVPYRLTLPTGRTDVGHTNAEGILRDAMPKGKQVVHLVYTPEGEDEIALDVEVDLFDDESEAAYAGRIRNLGFGGPRDSNRLTVLKFQLAHKKLRHTGELDDGDTAPITPHEPAEAPANRRTPAKARATMRSHQNADLEAMSKATEVDGPPVHMLREWGTPSKPARGWSAYSRTRKLLTACVLLVASLGFFVGALVLFRYIGIGRPTMVEQGKVAPATVNGAVNAIDAPAASSRLVAMTRFGVDDRDHAVGGHPTRDPKQTILALLEILAHDPGFPRLRAHGAGGHACAVACFCATESDLRDGAGGGEIGRVGGTQASARLDGALRRRRNAGHRDDDPSLDP